MEKLDKRDWKIINELYKDGRITVKKIGKAIHSSPETALYRMNRLQEKKILKQIIPIIDYSRIGYSRYRLQLKFKALNKKEKDELITYLKNLPKLSWLVILSGKWDVVLIFNLKSNQEFSDIHRKIMSEQGSQISEKSVSIVNKIAQVSPRHYPDIDMNLIITGESRASEELDKIDKQILQELYKDGRKSLLQIARDLDVSITTVKYHLDKMIKKEIIKGFWPIIDEKALGQDHFKAMVKLDDPSVIEKMNSLLLESKNVIYITEAIGVYDIEFEANFKSIHELLQFIETLGETIRINEFDIILNNKELVINQIPK